ncbi:hypothetical protein [Lysinibacillus mangiferihumi]|uniref:hypothetical protein n=1 Tax=Lysinibacillus mangiferihumi TaxID=1130819 RepID=UPI00142DE061|nr:hypothetical protein [Lysinibacillus mangiferihumi]
MFIHWGKKNNEIATKIVGIATRTKEIATKAEESPQKPPKSPQKPFVLRFVIGYIATQ